MLARPLTFMFTAIAFVAVSVPALARPLWGRDTAGFTQAVAWVPAQATVHVPDDDQDGLRPADLTTADTSPAPITLTNILVGIDHQISVSISVSGPLNVTNAIDSPDHLAALSTQLPQQSPFEVTTPIWLVGTPAPFASSFTANVPISLVRLTQFQSHLPSSTVYATWTITSL